MSKNIKRRIKTNEEQKSLNAKDGLKILLLMVVFSVLYLGVFAVFSTLFYPADSMPAIGAYSAHFLSSLAGGFFASRKIHKAGLVTGLLVGISYAFLIFLISLGVSDKAFFSAGKLIFFALSTIGGGLGGILGVNSGKTRYRRIS